MTMAHRWAWDEMKIVRWCRWRSANLVEDGELWNECRCTQNCRTNQHTTNHFTVSCDCSSGWNIGKFVRKTAVDCHTLALRSTQIDLTHEFAEKKSHAFAQHHNQRTIECFWLWLDHGKWKLKMPNAPPQAERTTYVRANWMEMSSSNSPTVAMSSVTHSPFGRDTSAKIDLESFDWPERLKDWRWTEDTYEYVFSHPNRLHWWHRMWCTSSMRHARYSCVETKEKHYKSV